MIPSARFQGKHVLITGAARGIGLATAHRFASEGASLTLFDSHAENLAGAVAGLKASDSIVEQAVVDVSNAALVREAVATADARFPIDILINNAGIASETPFLDISETEWKRIIDVNLHGMFHVAQSVARLMAGRRKGTIVNMGSKNGLDGEFGYAHYNASKAGVIMLSRTMALELAHLNIRVNCLCPGYIQTPLAEEIDSPEFTAAFVDRYIPMNRPGKVDEVAALFAFLASEDSSFMTGQVLIADGGQLAGQKPFAEALQKAGPHS